MRLETTLIEIVTRLMVIALAIIAAYITLELFVRKGLANVIPHPIDRNILLTLLSAIAISSICYAAVRAM